MRFFLSSLSLFSFQGPTRSSEPEPGIREPATRAPGPTSPDRRSFAASCFAVNCAASEKGSTLANRRPSTLFFHFFLRPVAGGAEFFCFSALARALNQRSNRQFWRSRSAKFFENFSSGCLLTVQVPFWSLFSEFCGLVPLGLKTCATRPEARVLRRCSSAARGGGSR